MEDLRDRLRSIGDRVAAAARRSGRSPGAVRMVAVTKTVEPERIREAMREGLALFGENRVQEARRKVAEVGPGATWHLVGHLQRNKAGQALEWFDIIHSVDSVELAATLDRRAAMRGQRVVPVLLEVNVGGEQSKFGFAPREEALFVAVERLLVLAHLRLDGLMTVAPIVADPEEVRPVFRRLHALREALGARYPEAPWTHLSMGMTDDYPVAVEEGATMVRVGRAIFGARPVLGSSKE